MLHLYNTLTRNLEEFKPLNLHQVNIYTCGPTVYSEPHLGNMRPYIFSDILRAIIRDICCHPVKHVVNITDVGHLTGDQNDTGEDKLEKGARREGLSTRQVAAKYEEAFKLYLTELQIEPFVYPRATEYIDGQIQVVKQLQSNGFTYEIPGDGIYMDTSLVSDYGKLLGPHYKKHIQGLQAGVRVDDTGKRNPTDFALWKYSRGEDHRQMERIFASADREQDRSGYRIIFPGEKGVYVTTTAISRDSLTLIELQTVGFPGRHIECSVMSRECLGDQIDIHWGGVDHIPIHHTNEIAQSECSFCTTEQFGSHRRRVQTWMHNQFLHISGTKMSKSAGDDLSLDRLKKEGFEASDLRYFFLQAHYRSFQDFSLAHLAAARKTRIKQRGKLYELVQQYTGHAIDPMTISLLQDKNIQITTPIYQLGCLYDVRTSIFRIIKGKELSHDTLVLDVFGEHQPINFQLINAIQSLTEDINIQELIAILLSRSYLADLAQSVDIRALELLYRLEKHIIKTGLFDFSYIQAQQEQVIPNNIQELIAQRIQAKAEKNRTQADVLRDEITTAGRMMTDSKDGMVIKKID